MWMFFTLTNLVIFVLYKKDSKKDSKMSDRTYIIVRAIAVMTQRIWKLSIPHDLII